MEILEITMKHFGRFTDRTMAFHPGVNIIYGDNETGKSTICSFIRGMFFGIDKMRGRASETDEYSLRTPWENGSYFAGTLRFRSGGKTYRIERNFERREKSALLICETDGTQSPLNRDAIRPFLDGMDETAFCSTVFFGGASARTDEGLALAVQNGMVNANLAGDARIDAAGALEKLKEDKKRLEREKKQKLAERINRVQELSMKIDYTRQEAENLLLSEQRYREELERLGDGADPEKDRDEYAEDQYGTPSADGMNGWKLGKILMAALAVAALAAGLVFTAWEVRAEAAAVIVLACLGVRFFGVRDEAARKAGRERELQMREQEMREAYERQRRRMERLQETMPRRQRLMANLEWTCSAGKEKRALLQNLEEEKEELQGDKGELEELERELAAVYLALDTLSDVTAQACREHARQINGRVSEIFSGITGGRYTGVSLDEHFQVRVHTPQRILSVWQMSRGAAEQLYFALRLACAEFLNRGEPVPLILDDAFVTYDDARLKQTLGWLRFGGRQILLFTCQKREQELLKELTGSPSPENG